MRKIQHGGYGGDHALVIGASTTGLITAAAIAKHFKRVTILERDALPIDAAWRKGAPHSRHVHVLLRGGRNIMDHYLPGFTTDMVDRGAELIDMSNDTAWFHSGGWKQRFPSGVTLLCSSKAFLEWNLRQRVEQIPNVRIESGQRVEGLWFTETRVGGAVVEDGLRIDADLIVDASGRASRVPQWLKAAGLAPPKLTELPVDVGYSSRTFVPAPGHSDWRALLVHPKHPDTRCGVLLPIESGKWQVTLVGWRGDHPPADDAGFIAWAGGLAAPEFRAAIEPAEPLEPVRQWVFPSNQRRHYEQLTTMPEGLVVVGDACASINPIYAQGMSHGAIGANILDECLAEQAGRGGGLRAAGLTARFHKRYAKLVDECWMTSTTEDYGCADSAKRGAIGSRLLNWYMARVNELTWTNQEAAKSFLQVMHFQKAPRSLFRPRILLRVLTNRAQLT